jgi:hypothetical protein
VNTLLTQSQLKEAFLQSLSFTRDKVEYYKQGGEYEMLFYRKVLRDLGYHGEDAQQVIAAVATAGFSYCLDPEVESDGSHPCEQVCWWGCDQLLSRLKCVEWRFK